MVKFSNPRIKAVFSDWPLGGAKRGQCTFEVQDGGKKGFRVGRTTTGKTKWNTYGGRAAIVDGDNGKTYILQQVPPVYGNWIRIDASDFKNASDIGRQHSVWEKDDPALHAELLALINEANKQVNLSAPSNTSAM